MSLRINSLECAGRAKRRRRFALSVTSRTRYRNHMKKSKAVSRCACHRTPKRG